MTERGMKLIDEYIELVKKRLPVSIADDVGFELKSYLEAAALDFGNGKLSEDGAKRAIAEFGAPADVASEYTESLIEKQQIDFENVKESVIWKMVILIALGHLSMIPASVMGRTGDLFQLAMGFNSIAFISLIWVVGIGLVVVRFYFKRKRSQFEDGDEILGKKGNLTKLIDLIISLSFLLPFALSSISLGYYPLIWYRWWGNPITFLFNILFGSVLITIALSMRVGIFALNALGKQIHVSQMILVISGILLCISYGFLIAAIILYPLPFVGFAPTLAICSWILLPLVAFDTSLNDTRIQMNEKRRRMLSMDERETAS